MWEAAWEAWWEAWWEAVVTEAVVTEAPRSMVAAAQRVVVRAVTAARTARATHMPRRIHSTAMAAHAVCANASDTNAAVSASAAVVEGSEADRVDGRDSQHRHPPAAMTVAATQTTRSAQMAALTRRTDRASASDAKAAGLLPIDGCRLGRVAVGTTDLDACPAARHLAQSGI